MLGENHHSIFQFQSFPGIYDDPDVGRGTRIHRSTTEKYSARFFNYLIWWVRVLVVVRVWVRVTLLVQRLWLG